MGEGQAGEVSGAAWSEREDFRWSDGEQAHEEQSWEDRFEGSVGNAEEGICGQQGTGLDQGCREGQEGAQRQGLRRHQRKDGARQDFVRESQGHLYRSLSQPELEPREACRTEQQSACCFCLGRRAPSREGYLICYEREPSRHISCEFRGHVPRVCSAALYRTHAPCIWACRCFPLYALTPGNQWMICT